jgi:hypothetical protein
MSCIMIRLFAILLALCTMTPMIPVAARSAEPVSASCHDDGTDTRQNAPADRQSQHACLGCCLPAYRFDVTSTALTPKPIYVSPAAQQVRKPPSGIDPPPPRALG